MSKLEEILSKQMTRKQFMLTMLTALGGLFGLTNLLALFTKNSSGANSQNPGYGERNYGP